MRKTIPLTMLIMILVPTVAFSEVTSKRKVDTVKRTATITFYSDGKEVARQIMDWAGAIIESTGTIPDGIVKEYYDDGTPMYESTYKKGRLDGLTRGYYKNGSLAGEWSYQNGKLDGEAKQYYQSGELQYRDTYKDDRIIMRKSYDKQGKLVEEKNMTVGKKGNKKDQEKATK